MRESRESRRSILHSYVEQFLDHLEQDIDGETTTGEMGSVVIAAEVLSDADTMIPTYFSSNENGIWRRGFFELLVDYHRIDSAGSEHDDGD